MKSGIKKEWIFLENVRRSGTVNMYGAVPYLQAAFCLDKNTARRILIDWMEHYDRHDYEEVCEV